MGTMSAKYDGKCSACGRGIRAGEKIDYSPATKARHLACAKGGGGAARSSGGASEKQINFALRLLGEAGYSTRHMDARYKALGATMNERKGSVQGWLEGKSSAEISALIDSLKARAAQGDTDTDSKPEAPRTAKYPTSAPVEGAVEISGNRDGRTDRRYEVGQTVVYDAKSASGAKYGVVLATKLWPPNEDGGHYSWSETAWVRPATEAEAAPLRERRAAEQAAKLAPKLVEHLLRTEGTRQPEELASLELIAPLAGTRWEYVAPTTQTNSGAVVAAMPGLSYQRVRVLESGAVVGHHGGHYDDYRPSAWLVTHPSEMLLQALAACTGDSSVASVVADAARELGLTP